MADGQVKKYYIIYILEVLKKYSDFDHKLSQQDIIDYMRLEYHIECERKAVSRNISDLRGLGYEISYDGGYFLETRDFEPAELRLLIDSVMAARYIPKSHAKDLIEKLKKQGNVHFAKQLKHTFNIENLQHVKSNELFLATELLAEAIEKKRKIAFFYNKYNSSKKFEHTTTEKHIVNPYQIVVANGNYYLISNIDSRQNLTYFRVERISDIEILPMPAKDHRMLPELREGFDLPKHQIEHVYMFSGTSQQIKMRVKPEGIDACIDWLGTDIHIDEDPENEGMYIVRFRANTNAILYWAIQFGAFFEVLEPLELREKITALLDEIIAKYAGRAKENESRFQNAEETC
ncbi:MAG: WYL domain-containing protein [Clostridia bacterium]|nr:WYL domain-containing protein [Clostridia bacterium]